MGCVPHCVIRPWVFNGQHHDLHLKSEALLRTGTAKRQHPEQQSELRSFQEKENSRVLVRVGSKHLLKDKKKRPVSPIVTNGGPPQEFRYRNYVIYMAEKTFRLRRLLYP